MYTRWGDIPSTAGSEKFALPVKDKLAKELAISESELPPIHQPSARHFPPGIVDPDRGRAVYNCDALTAHTIRLQQHAKEVQRLIDCIRLKSDAADSQPASDHLSSDVGAGKALMPPAVPPCVDCPRASRSRLLPFVPEDNGEPSKFERGQGSAPPPLDQAGAKRLLKRATSFVVAHAGFDAASQDALEIVVDVAHEFYLRLTQMLRAAVDSEALHGFTGFQDPMQQALHDVGIGGLADLHRFYWTRVIRRHAYCRYKCECLMQQCEQLIQAGPEENAAGILQLEGLGGGGEAIVHRNRSLLYPEANEGEVESDDDDDNDDAEKLLQLAGMSGYDIKLEQRPGSGVSSRRETSDNEGHLDGPLDSDYISSGPASTSSNLEMLSPPHLSNRHHQPLKRRKT